MGIEYDKEHVVENGIRVTQVLLLFHGAACVCVCSLAACKRSCVKALTASSLFPAQVFFHDPDRNMIEVSEVCV